MEPVRDITEDAAGTDPDAGLGAVAALRALTERLEILQVDKRPQGRMVLTADRRALGVTRQTVHHKHGKRTGRQS